MYRSLLDWLTPTVLDDQRRGRRTGGSRGVARLLAQMSQRTADPSGRRRPLGWQEAGRLRAVLFKTAAQTAGQLRARHSVQRWRWRRTWPTVKDNAFRFSLILLMAFLTYNDRRRGHSTRRLSEEAEQTWGPTLPYLTVVNRVHQENIKSLWRRESRLSSISPFIDCTFAVS